MIAVTDPPNKYWVGTLKQVITAFFLCPVQTIQKLD